MFKLLKATAAAALVALGLATAAPQSANAVPAVAANTITTGDTLTANVSCGGIDCDHVSQRGYTSYSRYKTRPRWRDRRRSRTYRYREFRGHRSRRWKHRRAHRSNKWKQRRVRRAVRNLVDAFAGGRW